MNNVAIELILGLLIGLTGIFTFLKIRNNFEIFSTIDLAIWSNAAIFGFAPWISFYYGNHKLSDVSLYILLETYGAVLFFIYGLFLMRAWTPKFKIKNGTQEYLGGFLKVITSFILFVDPTSMILFFIGTFFFQILFDLKAGFLSGINKSTWVKLPYWLTSINMMIGLFKYICVVWSVTSFLKGKNKLISMVILLSEFVFALIYARREMAFFLVLIFIIYLINEKKVKFKFVIGALALIVFANSFIFPLYLDIRIASYRFHYLSPLTKVSAIASYLITHPVLHTWGKRYARNMSHRALIIRPIARILKKQNTQPLMMGRAIVRTLYWVVPKVFLDQKYLHRQPLQYIEHFYGMASRDRGVDWPFFGCADWGIPGAFFMGLLLGGLLVFLEKVSGLLFKMGNVFFSLCVFSAALTIAFFFQTNLIADWIILRNVLILFILFKVFEWIKKQVKSRNK
jgi:hypothetical protein